MSSQGINPSLPGTHNAFWSHGLGQHSRTASTYVKQTQLTMLFTHALTLSTMGIRLRRKNPNTTGIEPSFFPPRGGRRTSTLPGRSSSKRECGERSLAQNEDLCCESDRGLKHGTYPVTLLYTIAKTHEHSLVFELSLPVLLWCVHALRLRFGSHELRYRR